VALEGRTMLTVTPLLGLPGMNINYGCPYEPSDTITASGPGQVVELVNVAMTVIDKTIGARFSTQSLSSSLNKRNGTIDTELSVTQTS
jgi:hypothetical protein